MYTHTITKNTNTHTNTDTSVANYPRFSWIVPDSVLLSQRPGLIPFYPGKAQDRHMHRLHVNRPKNWKLPAIWCKHRLCHTAIANLIKWTYTSSPLHKIDVHNIVHGKWLKSREFLDCVKGFRYSWGWQAWDTCMCTDILTHACMHAYTYTHTHTHINNHCWKHYHVA